MRARQRRDCALLPARLFGESPDPPPSGRVPEPPSRSIPGAGSGRGGRDARRRGAPWENPRAPGMAAAAAGGG